MKWHIFSLWILSFFTLAGYGQTKDHLIAEFRDFLEPHSDVISITSQVILEEVDGYYIEKFFHVETKVMTHFIQYLDRNKIKNGTYKEWYDSGNMWVEGEYVNNERQGLWSYYYDIEGYLSEFGEYVNDKRTGIWERFDKNGMTRVLSNYADDQLDGEQIVYHPDGREAIFRTYSQGEIISEEINDSVGLDPSFSGLRMAPKLGDCQDDECTWKAWLEFLYSELVYPASAKEHGIEGTAKFMLTIDSKGKVSKIETLHGLSDDLERSCRKLLDKSPVFVPATYGGKAVPYETAINIRFTLE